MSSNPDFVVDQPDAGQTTQPETEEEHRRKQLFHLGRKVAAAFNIRALNAWPTRSSSKVFVLTGSHFLLIKPKNVTSVSLFKWSSIQTFVIPENKEEIQLSFSKENKLALAEGYTVRTDKLEFKLTFDREQFDKIASEIISTVQRVLTDNELEKLGFSKLRAPLVANTAKSALCRLKMGTQGKPSRFSQKTIQLMTRIIQVGDPHVDLSQFDDIYKFLPTFLDCVPFIHTLRSIEIPQITKSSPFNLIAKLLRQNTTLKSITINGKLKAKDLSSLADAVKNNNNLKLRGIEFSLSSFTTQELNIITDLMTHTNINTLGFHDAFQSNQEVNYFYNSILDPSITQNLYCLNLSKTYNIDIEKLFPKLSKIRFLSLAYCDLEIIDVFSKLSLIALPRLSEIDLSGNRVSYDKYLEENLKLPQFLTSLILNHISWPADSFRLFIYQIFKHINKNLKLSLSNTVMDENEWYKVFASLENQNENGGYNGLSVLIWDYNPLHKKFFNFLKRNKRLTRLQMNYCFRSDSDETEVFSKLKDYLTGARNLKTLIIRGNEENNFGENTSKLIEAIKTIPNLEQLDISDSHGGNQSLKPIEELCTKNKSLKINFDGLYPTDFQEYTEYYTRLVSIRPPPSADGSDVNTNPSSVNQPSLLRISFPFNDMVYLVNKGVAKDRDFRHYEDLFYYSPDEEKNRILRVQKKNSKLKSSRFKPIKNSELSLPGNLFKLYADDDFPRYIDEEIVQQIKKDVQTFSINGSPDYDDDNINDMAFRSMLLNSRRFSVRASQESPSQSPLNSPMSFNQSRNVHSESEEETNSGTGEANDDESSRTQSESEEDNSNSDEKVPQTPKDAKIYEDQSNSDGNLSENESSVSQRDINERDVEVTQSEDDDQDEDNDNDEPNFDLPKLVDVRSYNYPGWKNLDKEFTLQNMYSRMTQSKRSSELASIKKKKGK